jgi:hypothetical protein
MQLYIDYKHSLGQPVGDLISRSTAHILPELGNLVVSELTPATLRGCKPRRASRHLELRRRLASAGAAPLRW